MDHVVIIAIIITARSNPEYQKTAMTDNILQITRPDDWHLHLRDHSAMAAVLPASAGSFARALVMPNLTPPLIHPAQVAAYRARIRQALPAAHRDFVPWFALYLSEAETTPADISEAAASDFILGVKYYPAGATTGSSAGVRRPERIYPILEQMERCDLPLQVHGEWLDADIDVFDREKCFLDKVLLPVLERFPGLRVVLEHISTQEAAQLVEQGPDRLAATITPQHLLYNRNALFADGLRPHHFCRPLLQAEVHRQAVVTAATSGHPRFFLGTDSAPHGRRDKEAACGCAGIYSAGVALPLYAQVFEDAGRLSALDYFAGGAGADFYRLPRNSGHLTLRRQTWRVPEAVPYGEDDVVPLYAGLECRWRLDTVE